MAATMSGAWSYAVPLGESENDRSVMARRETLDSSSNRERDHSAGGMGRNGAAPPLQKRSSAWDLQSDSEQAKQRRTSLRQSNTQATRKRSKPMLRGKQDDNTLVPRVDDSKWIHRDKLAQIEIKELQDAGYYVRPSRRSMSAGPNRDRSTSRSRGRQSSQEQQWQIDNDEDYAAAYPAHDESPRKMSTVLSADGDDEDGEYDDGQRAPVLQRPETYDPYRDSRFHPLGEGSSEQPAYRQHSGRPSTSRIPVSRASPAPVPQAVVERDSPLPRSRAGSQTWNGSFDEMQYTRKTRNGSIGSQALLEHNNETQGTSDENSPPKARVPKKTTPGSRKSSTGNAPAMQRPGSSHLKQTPSSATAKRSPSSGHKSRPSTSHMHAPEGEAPWIASMYKPDPRLPPDQQMLPTHAKRMMQEQWEKEGNTGTAYDRDLRLLNNDEFQKPKPSAYTPEERQPVSRSASASPTKQQRPSPKGSSSWEGKSDGARPPTSGGYRITPTIPDIPTMERFASANPPLAAAPVETAARVPDLNEKQEEAKPKRGCCCVIM